MGTKRRSEKRALPHAGEGGAGRPGQGGCPREIIATAVLVAVFVSLVAVSTLFRLSGWDRDSPHLRAAIADELGLTDPNPTFVQAATNMLEQAGYPVDYYRGQEVTVEFYRKLPKRGYDLIILRTHAARMRDKQGAFTDDAGLFTSDPYSNTRYVEEQRADRLRPARFYLDPAEGLPGYFGLTPDFVKSSMKGRFQDATIIVMGCDGLMSDTLAKAFVERGAAGMVSWNGMVSAAHTDAATEVLLRHLLVDGLTVREAVAQTMTQVGPDPAYGSSLLLYARDSVASGLEGAYLAR